MKMKTIRPLREIAVDIETRGCDIEDCNLNTGTKAYLREKFKRQRTAKAETDWTALDTDLNEIICICLYDGTNMYTFSQKTLDEREILEGFWKTISGIDILRLITFNGKQFDMPTIIKKSILWGVLPTRLISNKRYDEHTHCDLFGFFGSYLPTKSKTLNFYCDLYNVDKDTDIDICELIQTDNYDAIETKCMDDTRATYELYQRIKAFV